MTLRCGRIKYTNDLPVYAAFDRGAISYPGTLHADVPARLNAMLVGGELDLSPVSAYAYAQHADSLILLPDLCIGARDEVISVVLVSDTPPALLDGANIFVTGESATGRNLLRVLMERRYGVRPNYVDAEDALGAFRAAGTGASAQAVSNPKLHARAALLIGDRAIDALLQEPKESVYDLGRLWHEWTGEQTVFALWAARRETYEREPESIRACMHALTDSYTWSRGNMDFVIAQAQNAIARPEGFYETYYSKLNFMFHSAAQRGFAAFCRELKTIGALERIPSVSPEVIGVASR